MKLFDAYQVCVQTIKYMAKKTAKAVVPTIPPVTHNGQDVPAVVLGAEVCDQCYGTGLKNDNELCPKCQGHGGVAKN